MNFLKLNERLPDSVANDTSIVIMNERYQESLDLLLDEYKNKRIIYLPADSNNLFIDQSEHQENTVATFYTHEAPTATYNELMLESYRMSPDMVITESLENELASFSYDGGGTHYADSTDPRKESAERPLDFWLEVSSRGRELAIGIDAGTIEEAVVMLNDAVFELGKKILPKVLKVVYYNGERYAITEDQIKEILN